MATQKRRTAGKRARVSVSGVDLGEIVKWEVQPDAVDFPDANEQLREAIIRSLTIPADFFAGLSSAFAGTAAALQQMIASMSDVGAKVMAAYLKSLECLSLARPEPRDWPATVIQLATALQAGEDCYFALHDALLDAGAPELAEHFREKRVHHPDCCVLKSILGQSDDVGLDVTNAESPPGMRELIFGDPDAPRPQGIIEAPRRCG